MAESQTTTEATLPDRIWMRAEVLASPELREHFVKLNSNDIEYARVSASVAPPVANLEAWTSIDVWLRDNPNATAAECLAELVKRIKVESAPASTVAPQEQSEPPHDYAVTASTQCSNCGGGIADYWTYCHRCGANRETMTAPASPADIRDVAETYFAHAKTCAACGPEGFCSEGLRLYNASATPPSTRAKAAAQEIHDLCDELAPDIPNDSTSYAPAVEEIERIILKRCFTEWEDTK